MAQREELLGYLFILPWIIGVLVFALGPMAASFYFSLTKYDIVTSPRFTDLANYRKAFFEDPLFWKSLGNTAYYALISVPLGLVSSFLLACLLNAQIRGMVVYRVIYYLPSIIPVVGSSVLWVWILNPRLGLLNLVLKLLGLPTQSWLGNPDLAKPSLILMSLWGIGGGMVIYLAGLQDVPVHLYEAATINGAGGWAKWRHITIPMMTPTIFYNLLMGIVGSFQVFTSAFIMTGGGPLKATYFYMLNLYHNAFRFFRMGYASALAWFLFVILMLLTLVVFSSSGRWVYYMGGVD